MCGEAQTPPMAVSKRLAVGVAPAFRSRHNSVGRSDDSSPDASSPELTPDRCAAAQKTAAATFWSVLLPATTPRALPLSVTASRPSASIGAQPSPPLSAAPST